jgi:hypothetical protein
MIYVEDVDVPLPHQLPPEFFANLNDISVGSGAFMRRSDSTLENTRA